MKPLLILACCIASLLSTAVLAAKVYTWKDENGVTHYGERPPKEANAKMVRARTGHSDPVPQEIEQNGHQESASEASTDIATRLKDPERCNAARKNMELLNGNVRIKTPDEQGVLRYITEEERQAKYEETRVAIAESCE